jgi:hypothetical protein
MGVVNWLIGGGGSGSTSDDSTTDGPHEDGTMTSDESAGTANESSLDITGRQILGLLGISATAWAWLVGLARDPVGTIREILYDIIYLDLLKPAGVAMFDAFSASLRSFVVIAVGTDNAIGIEEGSVIGLLDIPFLFFGPMADAVSGVGNYVAGLIVTFNSGAADAAAQFGIAAPFVTTTLWVGEIAVAGYVSWVIVNAIDIPIVRIVAILETATAPFRRVLRWFQ